MSATPNTTRPQGNMGLDELNRIVLEFLHKKGYSRTEAMLRLESSRTTVPPQLTRGLAAAAPVTAPEQYIHTYALLQEWFESSLDMYQPELNRFMYPIFVHMYLELIRLGEPEKAIEFFNKFKESNELLHAQDLQALQGIRLPQHIEENKIAKQFVTQRYKIRVSPTAFDLVLHFLHSIEQLGGSTIIRLVNQHFNLEIVPKTESDADSDVGESSQPSKPLTLGRMPLDPDFRSEILATLEFRDKDKNKTGKDKDEKKGSSSQTNADSAKQPPELPQSLQPPQSEDSQSTQELVPLFEEMTKKESDSPAVDAIPLPKFRAEDVDAAVQRVVDATELAELGFSHRNQAQLPSVAMYTFHNTYDDMNCVSFSEDASLAAGGFADSYILLWSLKNQKLASVLPSENQEEVTTSRRLIGHSGPVYGVSFAPNMRTLLSCSEDHTARLWSLDTYTSLVCYRGHTEPIWDIAFGPFGHYFATASHDQTAMLWSTDHIYPLRIFAGHMSDVECVTFHPNGVYVFTGSADKTVRMWDVQKGACVRVFIGHAGAVTSVAVSPNGRWVAAAGDDGMIVVWDIGSGQRLKRMRGHGSGSIYSLSFSAQGEVLVSSGADCTVRVWDMQRNTLEQGPAPEPYDQLAQNTAGEQLQDDKRREVPSTSDHMAVFNTKQTPVYKVQFTNKNLVIAGGAFLP